MTLRRLRPSAPSARCAHIKNSRSDAHTVLAVAIRPITAPRSDRSESPLLSASDPCSSKLRVRRKGTGLSDVDCVFMTAVKSSTIVSLTGCFYDCDHAG